VAAPRIAKAGKQLKHVRRSHSFFSTDDAQQIELLNVIRSAERQNRIQHGASGHRLNMHSELHHYIAAQLAAQITEGRKRDG